MSPNTSIASFGVRRLLRRARVVLVLGWLAMWLGAVAHAACAVPLLPADSSGPVAQVGTIDYTSVLPHSASDSGVLYCQQLFDASTAAQSAVVLPTSDDRSADLLPAPAPQLLIVRANGWFANYPHRLPPPGCALYLRISRLLI